MSCRATHVLTRFSEAKYLKTSIFLNAVACIIRVPITVITREIIATFFTCMIIIFDSTVVYGRMFGDLICSVIINENPDTIANDESRTHARISRRTSILKKISNIFKAALSLTEVTNKAQNE